MNGKACLYKYYFWKLTYLSCTPQYFSGRKKTASNVAGFKSLKIYEQPKQLFMSKWQYMTILTSFSFLIWIIFKECWYILKICQINIRIFGSYFVSWPATFITDFAVNSVVKRIRYLKLPIYLLWMFPLFTIHKGFH